jgi:uncharacterized protein (TIGR02266 family)
MPICQACGEEMPEGARFCGCCGFRIGPPSPPGDRQVIRVAPEPALGGAEGELATAHTVRAAFPEELLPKTTVRKAPERSFDRYPMRVNVSYSSAHNFFTGASENISKGGVFICTDEPMPVGRFLQVTFTVPGLDLPCTVPCEVRWVRTPQDNPGAAPGMGLRFLYLDPQTEAAIDAFLTHREPILRSDIP